MADVAGAAGVSVSTVSHVINATRPVNDETRQRVEQAIEATGYRRNVVARSLARRESQVIGIAIAALTNPYFGPLVGAMNQVLGEAGYAVFVGDTGDDPEREQVVVNRMLDHRVDGLILAPSRAAAGYAVRESRLAGAALVFVDRHGDADVDQVTPENRHAAQQLTAHLAERGYSRIAAVAGQDGFDTTTERIGGYRDALAEHSLGFERVIPGYSRSDAAFEAVSQLVRAKSRPDAIVVMNNAMTIGAIRALQEAELRVPHDMALVSYDDFEWADLFTPRLTTMRQDLHVMARRAVELLLKRIAEPTAPTVWEQIPPSFQHRESCGCNRTR